MVHSKRKVKSILFLFLFICLSASTAAQTASEFLQKAETLMESGNKQEAKSCYQKAAQRGSAEAHFALAYRFVLPREKKIYHYSQAAKQGHEKALDYALELLFFRSSGLTGVYPKRALDLYHQAKKANPDVHIYNEAAQVKVLKMAAETADFDGQAFAEKYAIDSNIVTTMYGIWQLAEEASRPGGKFGKPDPKLVLALVVRGSSVPAEKMYAIQAVYQNYKKGIVKPFNICDFITSGYGSGFCALRANGEDARQRRRILDSLKQIAGAGIAPLLDTAYQKAVAFIEEKAELEEWHGGTGRSTWIIQSEMKQKHSFLHLIDSVQNGFQPQLTRSFKEMDDQLNETYQKALTVLGEEERPLQYYTRPDDLRSVQRLWIPFRDAAAKSFHALNPKVETTVWKAWLSRERIGQLNNIPGMNKKQN